MTTRTIITTNPPQTLKDEQGAYLPLTGSSGGAGSAAKPTEEYYPSPADTSLSEVLGRQLLALSRITRHLATKATDNTMTVPEIGALATLIKITMELKVKENELLDKLTDEELAASSVDGSKSED